MSLGKPRVAAGRAAYSQLSGIDGVGVSAVLCPHWDKVFRARRSGFSDRSARVLRPLSPRLPGRYLASMLADVLLLIGVPYADELLRCPRGRRA